MSRALQGIRVVDLSHVLAAPTCSMFPEDLGAEVIHIELIPILGVEMAEKTTKEWADIFEKAGLPYSPINGIKKICEDPHIAHRNMLVEIDQPKIGRIKIAGSPIRLSETPGEVYAPAPLLGEHSEEVLKDVLGYSQEKVSSLLKEGVIKGPEL